MDFFPDDVFHLPIRRTEDDDLALFEDAEPPRDQTPGCPVLAGSIAADDRHAPVISHRAQVLGLLRI